MKPPAPPNGATDLLVLCYHGVRPRPAHPLDVSLPAFRRQIELLLGKGYEPATFLEAVTAPPRARTLAVTLDDGDRSVVDHALPILSELGVPATAFVPLDAVAPPGSLTVDELRMLLAAGWEIGSHTVTHEDLTELDDRDLERELRVSREQLERLLGRPIRSLAYPFGEADDRVIAAAKEAGYVAACLLDGRFAAASLLAWPRVGVGPHDGTVVFRIKTAPVVRRARGSVVGEPINLLLRKLRRFQRAHAAM